MDTTKELKLDYPCDWQYKIILEKELDVKNMLQDALGERTYTIKKSKNSTQGKYTSYLLEALVHNDDDRKELYKSLKKNKKIKFVL